MTNCKPKWIPITLFVSSITASPFAISQSTPSEFAEMNLSELFEQSIDESEKSSTGKSPWTFTLQYKRVEFEGYLDGTEKLSVDEVLWSGPEEPRTDKNFPIVPTVITQEAYVLAVGYEINPDWRVHFSIPRIKQNTDHVSIVPDYDQFCIETSGIGDVAISASHKFKSTVTSNWWATLGVSLPTGSIDEKGDTPRAPGDQQLPYTMQLGSGTYDLPLEIVYQSSGEHDWSASVSAKVRTGTNDRNYRLGNNYAIQGRYKFHLFPTVQPFVGLNFQYSESIHGMDDSLLVDSEYPYPASITNPDYYGGKKIGARAGVSWQIFNHYRLVADIGKPLYQNLNGPQPKQGWRSSLQFSRIL